VADAATPRVALAPGSSAGPPAPPAPSGSDVLTSSADLSGSGRRYAIAVARIGVQVAEALEYAAEQGIIHRDVKPSNILLDLTGTAWVTDFGLAKVAGQEDLTHTGDLVGTLRYMAPERFRGQADGRGDVYALGLTLYELLALRPAYDESDRGRLIRQVTEEDPPRLTKLDPSLPRDLATVVHTAMAREPAGRYATAGALAADLRRYLEDRPIVARRPSLLDRVAKWSRRYRAAVATAAVAVVVLLVALSVVASVAALRLSEEQNATLKQLEATRKAQKEGQHRLYEARLATARASRWSGRAGRRSVGLQALTEAAKLAQELNLGPEAILTIRNEAIACLALVDLRLDQKWSGYPPGSTLTGIAFDRDMNRYARVHEDGYITVRRLADNQETIRINDLGAPASARPSAHWRMKLEFSPDGHYLAVVGSKRFSIPLQVWDLRGPRSLFKAPPADGYERTIEFRPDGRILAARGADESSIRLFDVRAGRELNSFALGRRIVCLRFDPPGDRIAVSLGPEVRVLDLAGRPTGRPLAHPKLVSSLSWSADGRLLATACEDGQAYVWNLRTGHLQAICPCDTIGALASVALNRRGDLLATASSAATRLWDPWSGKELLSTGSLASDFSRDGHWLGLGVFGPEVGRWEVAGDGEYRLLHGHSPGSEVRSLDVSPDSRLLASAGRDRVRLWDLAAGQEIAALPTGETDTVIFDRAGGFLITSGVSGLYRWPLSIPAASPSARIQVGPPEPIRPRPPWNPAFHASLSEDGRAIAVKTREGRAAILNLARPNDRPRMIDHAVTFLALSPDARWVATNAAEAFESKLWDARSGQWVRDFPGMRTAVPSFSPDNRWLVFATAQEFRFHRVESWEPGPRWKRDYSGYQPGTIAFTRSGQTVAIAHSAQEIKLLDVDSGRELATLAAPVPEPLQGLAFTPDGCRLVAGTTTGVIQLWDLRRIRSRLRLAGLDWDPPPQPPRADDEAPVSVALDRGELSEPEQSTLILALSPFEARAYSRRGLAFARRGRWREALDDFRRSLALRPNQAEPHYQRGLIRARLRQTQEAIADFSRAIAIAPDHAEAYAARGDAHSVRRAWEQAAGDYSKAADLRPDWPECANNAAWFLATHPDPGRRDPGRAVLLARRSVDLDCDEAMSWNTLGVAHYRARHWDEAIAALTRSMDLFGGHAEGYNTFFLAMSHWQLGDKEEARRWYDRAVQWVEKNPPTDDELPRFRAEAAELLQIQGRTSSEPRESPR
jgi:WD40 repeat protein/Flp pilus assembly protein TadD